MKKLILPMAIALATITIVPTTKSASVAQNLCEYVAADDKKRMRSFLKTNKLKVRSVFKGSSVMAKIFLCLQHQQGLLTQVC